MHGNALSKLIGVQNAVSGVKPTNVNSVERIKRQMLRTFFVLVLGICLSVMLVTKAPAQSITSGDITGTITDPSGARVPNASISVNNVNTNATQSTKTSQDGTYRFAFLPQGKYNVNVKATGFQPQQVNSIVVSAGQPTTADIRLQVAAANQTVEVSEAAG